MTTRAARAARAATHQEDGDPGQADVVERDGALERVVAADAAVRVVQVPVDARVVGRDLVLEQAVDGARRRGRHARDVADLVGRDVGAQVHAVVLGLAADVVLLLVHELVVLDEGPAENRGKVSAGGGRFRGSSVWVLVFLVRKVAMCSVSCERPRGILDC